MMHNTGITADTADTAEVAALAVDGPQAVWMTLDAARERAFTGEIVFETEPEVFAYLDNGIVYYAERASDVSLGRRLLRAGVVDDAQLECGTVRVGDIEHLGRLFDRDPSIDRDAVIVLAETTTQELITELANQSIAPARLTAYRHHPSGVHRWFVAPVDPTAMPMPRPVSAVAQLDSTVLDDLPALSFDDADVDDLVIEWDDDIDGIPELHTDVFELSSPVLVEYSEYSAYIDADGFIDADAGADADAADGDVAGAGDDDADADDHAVGAAPTDVEPVDDIDVSGAGETARADDEFSVVWPDGSEEPATELAAEVDAVLETDARGLRFTMPPLELSDEPASADAEVPDDVAEAVRRAIAAIESASVAVPAAESGPESSVQLGAVTHGEVLTEPPITEMVDPAPSVQATAKTPHGPGGFAPPTMATHAEVLYAQMEAGGSMADGAPDLDAAKTGSDSGDERSSALRRLIGSLRRKNH